MAPARHACTGPAAAAGHCAIAPVKGHRLIYTIRRRKGRRRPFEVRWVAAGQVRSKSSITRALADSYRGELVHAAHKGLEFDPATGEPVPWAEPEPVTVTWYQHAIGYAAMKWPTLAAHSRASLAEALATVTPALTWTMPKRPQAAVLRCTGTPSIPVTQPPRTWPPHGSWTGCSGPHCPSPGWPTPWCSARRWMPSRCGWLADAPRRTPSSAGERYSAARWGTRSRPGC